MQLQLNNERVRLQFYLHFESKRTEIHKVVH